MKDARFKELLNLYIDHALSDAEAVEFHAELRADPKRRAMLRQYETMHGACAQVFARIEARAPSSEALCRALRRVEEQIENPRAMRDAWGWPTWGVTGGLAACVALVVARMSQPTMVASGPAADDATGALRSLAATSAVASVASVPVQATVIRRAAMPNQIAFAALGMSPSSANADAASHWILTHEEVGVAEASPAAEYVPTWATATSSPAYSSNGFSIRPINAWGRASVSTAGYQVESASYRFER
jgi:hypothetical protein